MATANRPTTQDRYRKIVVAIPKYMSSFVEIILAGITFTPTTLVQFFQQQIALLDGATNARATLHQFAQDIKSNKLKNGAVLKSFNDAVRASFGNQPQVLAEFGLAPHKVPITKTGVKALAAAKNLATRAARHTMGKKQKAKVKGVVPVPLPTPPGTSNPGSAPTAAPATPPAPVAPSPVVMPAPAVATPVEAPTAAPPANNGAPPTHTP